VTYSIVGADSLSGQVGGAGTSCLMGDDVYVIYRGLPGRGVVHAQARYNTAARDRAAQLLEMGSSPAEIVAAITAASYDASAQVRQYGVIDVLGRTAAFTGTRTMPFAGDRQGASDHFAYSVQGNILTSEAVLSQAARAFEGGGCDLAERLMNALEAGASGGEGDSRCTPSGIPSDSAFLQIEAPDAAASVSLRVRTAAQSPLPLLRAQLDAWRAEHPCPKPVQPAAAANGPEASTGCQCQSVMGNVPSAVLVLSLLGSLLLVVRRRKRMTRPCVPSSRS